MFHSPHGLPHLLKPDAYRDDVWAAREWSGPLASAWHLVGTTSELSRHGDFLTVELLGKPIQVRRFDESLIAISNVCAHRHCLISSDVMGNSPSMRCQYHAWEYGPDGYTRKIPAAKDLAPMQRDDFRLDRYAVDTCGQLVFVRISPSGPSLSEYLGPLLQKFQYGFGAQTKCYLSWSVQYASNWKVAIENSLEAYHVESVHPSTFRKDPGEQRSEHILDANHTAFGTDLPFAHSKLDLLFQKWESRIVSQLGIVPTKSYWQHHVFPNLLGSFTDAISLVHCVVPTSTKTSRSKIYQFGPCPDSGFYKRHLAKGWGWLEAACTKRILQEDVQMYPRIQSGLNASRHSGRLARSEERIHRFQEYMLKWVGENEVMSSKAQPS